jgi:hypothetical protein
MLLWDMQLSFAGRYGIIGGLYCIGRCYLVALQDVFFGFNAYNACVLRRDFGAGNPKNFLIVQSLCHIGVICMGGQENWAI